MKATFTCPEDSCSFVTDIDLKPAVGETVYGHGNIYTIRAITWSLGDYPYPAILLVTIEKARTKS
jgi:hypothetical protein|nr:MAG TPA: hypothetical protein [Caudoviricetes sp.]